MKDNSYFHYHGLRLPIFRVHDSNKKLRTIFIPFFTTHLPGTMRQFVDNTESLLQKILSHFVKFFGHYHKRTQNSVKLLRWSVIKNS